MIDYAMNIKKSISMKQVLNYYGISTNNKGFALCPFHKEKTGSFLAYDNDKGYYCFGCGASGDIIKFVQEYFNLSFKDALSKINQDFGLNLPIGKQLSLREKRKLETTQKERIKQINDEKTKHDDLKNNYWNCYDELIKFENWIKEYKPKSIDEEPNPLFVEAIHGIEIAKINFDIAEMRLYEYEHQ